MAHPIARTIVLTDSGTAAFSAALASYDGTAVVVPVTIDTALASSSVTAGAVVGLPALFIALYLRLGTITARAEALRARRLALTTRINALES